MPRAFIPRAPFRPLPREFMAVLFIVVFVDLVGFGLLLPLLPFYVQRTGAGPEVITLVLGLYSLAQFIAAPFWGRLSDRFGRKPVLTVTSIGLGLSYVLLAYADSLALVAASRIFGGLMAGNIAAAQAYVADVTTPERRARGMGVLGAAFGLGFIIGPAIGGLLGGADVESADFVSPALGAMALSFAAAFGVVVFLKESLPKEARRTLEQRAGWREKIAAIAQRRALLMLVATGFLVITAWAQFETVFALWANAIFSYGPREIGLILGFMGVINVAVQGVFMGALARRFGEKRLALSSVALFILGFVTMAASSDLPVMLAACAVLALASALFNPSVTSLVSQEAASGERGTVLGAYHAAAALGRVVGPAFSGALFAAGPVLAFAIAAALAAPALLLVASVPKRAGTN